MRRKPWARPELAACPFFIGEPAALRGRWKDACARPAQPLWLELGIGKGSYTAALAAGRPDSNLIGVDIKSEVLVLAKRNAEREFSAADRPVDNLLLLSQDIERIGQMLSPEDQIERLLINFCNPWPKQQGWKHRLTHTRQLESYRKFLIPGGELQLKTDDLPLVEATLGYLAEAGYAVVECVRGLPSEHPAAALQSEHEQRFRACGLPIYYLCATAPKKENIP
ncbi:MAG: tRNA (guanosine(46)-N7)-methyltransferase TrmB [Oscillospiraceae bacterium]